MKRRNFIASAVACCCAPFAAMKAKAATETSNKPKGIWKIGPVSEHTRQGKYLGSLQNGDFISLADLDCFKKMLKPDGTVYRAHGIFFELIADPIRTEHGWVARAYRYSLKGYRDPGHYYQNNHFEIRSDTDLA